MCVYSPSSAHTLRGTCPRRSKSADGNYSVHVHGGTFEQPVLHACPHRTCIPAKRSSCVNTKSPSRNAADHTCCPTSPRVVAILCTTVSTSCAGRRRWDELRGRLRCLVTLLQLLSSSSLPPLSSLSSLPLLPSSALLPARASYADELVLVSVLVFCRGGGVR